MSERESSTANTVSGYVPGECPAKPPARKLVRVLLAIAGGISLALGVVGVVLPGLPTTPFILLTAFCWAKASPRLHRRLLDHKWTGPLLRDWEANRSLTVRTKAIAVCSMLVMVCISAWGFRERPLAVATLLALAAVGAWVVLRIPTRK
ncbi:YbaN family protein [Hydrogenophaga sp. 5NK40-0174]|uniref:YbaN family protein n=1 Tax=Hydrogenophaga sp. 5NK40-0174 TaxID=3127649 RepID=UPI00310377A4